MTVVNALWPVQDAKARFSELLDICIANGPQTISRRGVPQAVIVPVKQWEQAFAQQVTLKQVLLDDAGRFDVDLPARGQGRHREIDQY